MESGDALSSPEVAERVIQQCLELFFNPEVERRLATVAIQLPFELIAAQIVFSPAGTSSVRINNEVRFALSATLTDGSTTVDGERYRNTDIESVQQFRLTPADKDCGHVTLFRSSAGWTLCFDFRRNQDTCRSYKRAAQDFLDTAQHARDALRWRVFVDTLFSACEIAAKASLLWFADEQFRDKTNHKAVSARFNLYARSGNVPSDVRDIFNTLLRDRSSARYLKGECELDPVEADRWIRVVQEFIKSLA